MGSSILRAVELIAAAVYGYYTGNWQYFAAVATSAHAQRIAERDRRRAVAKYNASLQDRLEMVDLQPDAPRTLPMGRLRYVEGVRRRWSSGDNKEKLTMVVSFAGCQIDAYEQWYLNDMPVTLDADGWVQEAPYAKTHPELRQVTGALDGTGGATVTLTETPVTGTLAAVWSTGAGDSLTEGSATVSISGLVVTISGGPLFFGSYSLVYQTLVGTKTVRIRPYLGTATQSVGADHAAEYPGSLATTDAFAGMAVALVDVLFDPDVFPQGRPNVTALIRAALLYDPRKDSTVPGGSGSHRIGTPSTWQWSENPALQALRYALWENGWALPVQDLNLADVMAAADVCDISTTYTLRKSDDTTSTVTLPRHTCAVAPAADAEPDSRRSNMSTIMETMAGADGWAGGVWRFRAGAVATPSFTLDESWLVQPLDATGQTNGEPVIRGASAFPREQRINRVTGSCVDPAQRYQVLPYPAVQDDVLVAAKGVRAAEITWEGVNNIAHAQHLATVAIRQAQAGLRLEAVCNHNALAVELFDVGTLLLPRFGMTEALAKTAEVTGWKGGIGTPIALTLAEISDAIFDPSAELKGRDPAPDTALRPPWDVDTLGTITVTSGTTETLDGSVLTRTTVTWPAAHGQNILQGGAIELQYTPVADTLPTGAWPSVEEQGSALGTVIAGLLAGRFYVFRGRQVQKVPLVRGAWSKLTTAQIAQAPDANLYALDLGVPAIVLPASAAGVVSSYTGATTTPRVLRSGVDATSGWTLSRTNGSGVSSTLSGGVLTITALADAADSGYVDVKATRVGYADLVQRLTISKSKTGINGGNAYGLVTNGGFETGTLLGWPLSEGSIVSGVAHSGSYCMRLASAAGGPNVISAPWPVLPGQVYTLTCFAARDAGAVPDAGLSLGYRYYDSAMTELGRGGVAAGDHTVSGWQALSGEYTVPAGVAFLALDVGEATGTAGAWYVDDCSATLKGAPGSDGAPGSNNGLAYIYQRGTSAPALPSVTATYTFASGAVTGLNNGWADTIPAGTDPLYVSVATASAAATTDTIAAGEWAAAQVFAANGLNAATIYLYQRNSTGTAPTAPASATTYTFATGALSGTLGSWTQTVPDASGGKYLFVTTAAALSAAATDSIASGEWATVRKLAQDGSDGTDGTDGTNGAPGVGASVVPIGLVLQADSGGVVTSGELPTDITAAATLGGVDDTANWTWSRTSTSGITTTISGAVVTVTAMDASLDSGTVTITGTKAGLSNIVLVAPVTKAKSAAAGSGVLNALYFQNYNHGATAAHSGVRFNADGTVSAKDGSGTYVAAGNWYSPTTSGIGSSYWLKVVLRSGYAAFSAGTVGSFVALSSARVYEQDVSSGSHDYWSMADYYIASASGGNPVEGTGTLDVEADTT